MKPCAGAIPWKGPVSDRSAQLRRRYAAEIARRAGIVDPRVEAAFAAVPREDFCGPPPGSCPAASALAGTADVARLYQDALVAIDASRGINNGQPSLHALCIDALKLKEGETVVQIGAGAGYYTAILAHLVGRTGRVIAYEIEPDIAERARANLARFPQVEVRAHSGVGEALPATDATYVNAAATHPLPTWLDALNVGGRLMFPLQAAHSTGAMLLVTRPARGRAWPARFLSEIVFIACEGAQDARLGQKLDDAFRRGGWRAVRSLRFGEEPSESDWLRGDGWALSSEEAG